MSNPLISVIVPIYNVEKYLREALDSIINQTYKNLEIILVDDGSPDKSGEICDEYAQKDLRIKVIHKKNAGVGMARNSGLDIATGEYCIFPDPDDVMYLDQIEYLYRLIETYQVDMSVCALEHKKKSNAVFDEINVLKHSDAFKYVLSSGDFGPCNKLFSLTKIKKVRFGSYFRAQDALYVMTAMTHFNSIVVSPEIKYFYRVSDSSVSYSSFRIKELDGIEVFKEIVKLTKLNFPQFEKLALLRYEDIIVFFIAKIVESGSFYSDIKNRKIVLKRLLAESRGGPFNARVSMMKYWAAKHLNIYLLPVAFKVADVISDTYQFLKKVKK